MTRLTGLAFACALAADGAASGREEPTSARDRAIAAVERLGGAADVDKTRPGKPVVGVDLSRTAVTDADLVLLEWLPELEALDLRLTSVGDAGVAHLAGTKTLRFVNLFRTHLTDAGLPHLAGNAGLETLLVGGTQVTDDGLARLAAFPRLRKLSVFDTRVGDAGLEHLRRHSRLETLLLDKSKVTEAGKERISAALPGVRFGEPSPREAVLSAVRRFFDTMAARDAAGAAAVVLPEGRFVSARVVDGRSVTRSFTNREYLNQLPARKEDVMERIWDPEVRIRGRIASAWAPYDFWKDGAFSHCGVDAFDLVSTLEGWKIAGGVYTVETEGCAPSPLGAPRFETPAGEMAPPPAP
jgi:hypothetical protein